MNSDKTISHMLHALADGQLDANKRKEILSHLENNIELRGEMCDIYRIKDLIQTAYPISDIPSIEKPFSSRFYSFAKVASYFLVFFLALATGYTLRDLNLLKNKSHFHDGVSLSNTTVQDNKVILFLSSSEPRKFQKALLKAENLAKKFQKTNGHIYVVTSAAGIDLLRLKTSPYKQKIKTLGDLYPSLHFVACNNTLFQYKKAGQAIELIESAEVAPSAVEFVVKHLQQGWRYIAI